MIYLFGKGVERGQVSVSLAVNGGICTASNSIHFPVGVVIVHYMEVTMSTSAFSVDLILVIELNARTIPTPPPKKRKGKRARKTGLTTWASSE